MVEDQASHLLSYRVQLSDAHQALQEREAELKQQALRAAAETAAVKRRRKDSVGEA